MALTRVSRHIIDEPFNPTTVSATDVTATNINASGIGTVGTLNVTGNLTVQGTTTTLDTILTEVDKLEVGQIIIQLVLRLPRVVVEIF